MNLSEIYKLNTVEISERIEQKRGNGLSFSSEFSYIGRGNVLRDSFVEHKQINSEIDSILWIVK